MPRRSKLAGALRKGDAQCLEMRREPRRIELLNRPEIVGERLHFVIESGRTTTICLQTNDQAFKPEDESLGTAREQRPRRFGFDDKLGVGCSKSTGQSEDESLIERPGWHPMRQLIS